MTDLSWTLSLLAIVVAIGITVFAIIDIRMREHRYKQLRKRRERSTFNE